MHNRTNSSPIISIIIPVYNGEKTIKRTLDSLTVNTYDIEIICVNDGSRDNTEEIVNQKIKEDNRIRQIVQENGGASKARNYGISNCKGKYIMFCDADDEYDYNLLKYIIEDIKSFTPDYIVFNRRTVYEDGSGFNWLKKENVIAWEEFSCTDYFNDTLIKRSHSYVVFNKAYKAEIVHRNHIVFNEELELCEDLYFNFAFLQHAKNMVEDGRAKYLQHKVPNSLTASKRKDYYQQNIKVLGIINWEYGKEIREYEPFVNKHILNSGIHAIDRVMLGRDAYSIYEKRNLIKGILNDSKFKEAYDKYACYSKPYTRKRLTLLHNRFLLLYYMRFIILPHIKSKMVQKWIL